MIICNLELAAHILVKYGWYVKSISNVYECFRKKLEIPDDTGVCNIIR